jgi:hypothetical protein
MRLSTQYLVASVLVVSVLIVGLWFAVAHAQQLQTYYDRDGHYAGQSSTYNGGRNTSYTDRNGRFDGSAVHNNDGTTTYYDRNGHFVGAASRPSPRR